MQVPTKVSSDLTPKTPVRIIGGDKGLRVEVRGWSPRLDKQTDDGAGM